jgi:hypothetical protein
VILGLKPVCYRVMPAALLQYRNESRGRVRVRVFEFD